jgi:hypothetical protein
LRAATRLVIANLTNNKSVQLHVLDKKKKRWPYLHTALCCTAGINE